MKTLLSLCAVALLLSCGAGDGSSSGGEPSLLETLKVDFIPSGFCCDPNHSAPQEIGTLRITHQGGPGSRDVYVALGEFVGGGVSIEPGVDTDLTLTDGDVLDTKLYATNCDWTKAIADLTYLRGESETVSQQLELNNLCGPLDDLMGLMNQITASMDEVAILRHSARRTETGQPVPWSAPRVAPEIPFPLWVELNRLGIFNFRLLIDDITRAFGTITPFMQGLGPSKMTGGDFPCGDGPHGHTVCSTMAVDMAEDDYVFAYFSAEEDIPLNSTRLITYGFVFDSDGDPSNNYVPHPSFPDDYFKDTDRWYTLEYVPLAG